MQVRTHYCTTHAIDGARRYAGRGIAGGLDRFDSGRACINSLCEAGSAGVWGSLVKRAVFDCFFLEPMDKSPESRGCENLQPALPPGDL